MGRLDCRGGQRARERQRMTGTGRRRVAEGPGVSRAVGRRGSRRGRTMFRDDQERFKALGSEPGDACSLTVERVTWAGTIQRRPVWGVPRGAPTLSRLRCSGACSRARKAWLELGCAGDGRRGRRVQRQAPGPCQRDHARGTMPEGPCRRSRDEKAQRRHAKGTSQAGAARRCQTAVSTVGVENSQADACCGPAGDGVQPR